MNDAMRALALAGKLYEEFHDGKSSIELKSSRFNVLLRPGQNCAEIGDESV